MGPYLRLPFLMLERPGDSFIPAPILNALDSVGRVLMRCAYAKVFSTAIECISGFMVYIVSRSGMNDESVESYRCYFAITPCCSNGVLATHTPFPLIQV